MSAAATSYAGPADRQQMVDWLAAHPRVECVHAGDLVWRARGRSDDELATEIVLWREAGHLRGWTWLRKSGSLDLITAPEEAGRSPLIAAMLDQVHHQGSQRFADGTVGDTLHTFFRRGDALLRQHLEERGFRHDVSRDAQVLHLPRHVVPPLRLPTGYSVSDLSDRSRLPGRVDAQRQAFASTSATVEVHAGLAASSLYRPELDVVLLDADRGVAAFATGWFDRGSASGIVEPAGTVPAGFEPRYVEITLSKTLAADS